jgi:hypothetical protein
LWWVDECESLANGVAAEFIDQGHGGGRIAGLISLYRDAVYDDFCESFLGYNACG